MARRKKDRKSQDLSMVDHIHDKEGMLTPVESGSSDVEDSPDVDLSEIIPSEYDSDVEYQEALVKYNENIRNLNPLYSEEITPVHRMIVRCYTIPMERRGDLLIPNQKTLSVRTNNGVGPWAKLPNPYPYSRKAVVVNVPPGADYEKYKPGMEILLQKDPTNAVVIGRGESASIVIDNYFIHPDYEDKFQSIPSDPNNDHYGYILVTDYDVDIMMTK